MSKFSQAAGLSLTTKETQGLYQRSGSRMEHRKQDPYEAKAGVDTWLGKVGRLRACLFVKERI